MLEIDHGGREFGDADIAVNERRQDGAAIRPRGRRSVGFHDSIAYSVEWPAHRRTDVLLAPSRLRHRTIELEQYAFGAEDDLHIFVSQGIF